MINRFVIGFLGGFVTELVKGAIPAVKEWSNSRETILRYFMQDDKDGTPFLFLEKMEKNETAAQAHELFRRMSKGEKKHLDNFVVRNVRFSSYQFGRDFRPTDVKIIAANLKNVTLTQAGW